MYNEKYCVKLFLFFNGHFKKCTFHRSFGEVNETLSVILLLELLGCCGRLGLAMFIVLTVSTCIFLSTELLIRMKRIHDSGNIVALLISMFLHTFQKLGTDFGAVIIYFFYAIVQVGWLFLFCYIGEEIIFEVFDLCNKFFCRGTNPIRKYLYRAT